MIVTTQAEAQARAGPVSSWPRGWRAAAGLTSVAAGAVIVAGAFLPWVEAFGGLVQVPGVRGSNGWILAAAGSVIAVAGLVHLARPGQAARWTAGLAGFAAAGFSGYLLIQLAKSMRVLGGESMVIARPGPGLWAALAGALAAFVVLFFPPSSQATLRREGSRPVLALMADRESDGIRRGLQVALGLVWLLDAALQYQPVMFTRAFPVTMLMPSGMGEPAFVSGPVLTASRLIAGQVVPWNALFATVQLALAVGLLSRATARAALAAWGLGQGFGEIFSGTATDPGTGPLLVLIALAYWPRSAGSGRSAPYSCSTTALIRSSVARMPSRLVRSRPRPPRAQ